VTKAQAWWEERSDEPFPDNCEEFMFLKDSLAEPKTIMVVKDGKFDRIVECIFAADDEPYSETENTFDSDQTIELPF